MENIDPLSGNGESPTPSTALSIFGNSTTAGGNDFPVLKAFQEYIDAEQAKARKRMIGLSAFFIVLMLVVVCTFVVILVAVMNRNQSLSDRLLDYALKERTAPAVQAVPAAQPAPAAQPEKEATAALKPVLDQLARLTEKLDRPAAAAQPAVAPTPAQQPAPAAAEPSREQQQIAKLRQEREKLELETERKKLKETKERLHREEVEKHRRVLYPEYYAKLDAEKARAAQAAKTPAEVPPAAKPVTSVEPAKAAEEPAPAAKPGGKLGAMKPINYFDAADDDEELKELARLAASKRKLQPAAKPAAKKAPPPVVQPAAKAAPAEKPAPKPAAAKITPAPQPATQTLTVSSESNSIPWLIELPAAGK